MTIIPLGTRCSAAYIVQRNLKLRVEAYPFDWMDIHLKNIGKFLDLDYDKVEPFVRKYFSEIEPHTQRHPDGTWFPHDVFGGYDHKEMTEKYVKRFLRLHNTLLNQKDLVFLSVTANGSYGNDVDYKNIKSTIRKRFGNNPLFITGNLFQTEMDLDGRHYNFNTPFIDTGNMAEDFAVWEKKLADKIIKSEIL